MFMWGHEPVQYKGGRMTMIPKKQDMSKVGNFRGILLLPSLAKRVHALLRRQLIECFLPHRDESQLGGLPAQQVLFGSHAVRTAARVFESWRWSVGVIFIDLSNAFHRLIREWITGIQHNDDFCAVLHALEYADNPDDFHARVCELQGIIKSLACPPVLRRLLADIHSGTWFRIFQSEFVRTRRGTRPGSPLADAVFHVLMGRITSELRTWIMTQTDYMTLLEEADMEIPRVVWSDDLALVWTTRTASALPDAVQRVMCAIDQKFTAYGFDLNYSRGKTEAVITFRGAGASDLRKQHLLSERPGLAVALPSGREVWLHFSVCYKHLGTIYST